MALFRFPHFWPAVAQQAPEVEPIVDLLDDRDRALEDYLARESVARGSFSAVFSAVSSVSGTVDFVSAFKGVPVVTFGVQVGSNLDINVNMQGVVTTGFTWRAFQNLGSVVTGTATVYWHAIEP